MNNKRNNSAFCDIHMELRSGDIFAASSMPGEQGVAHLVSSYLWFEFSRSALLVPDLLVKRFL